MSLEKVGDGKLKNGGRGDELREDGVGCEEGGWEVPWV
jgi:hypothetical protein